MHDATIAVLTDLDIRESGVRINQGRFNLSGCVCPHTMAMDYVLHFEAIVLDCPNRLEFQHLVILGVDRFLLTGRMREDAIALASTDVKRCSVARVD
jgi:hypothetical protein